MHSALDNIMIIFPLFIPRKYILACEKIGLFKFLGSHVSMNPTWVNFVFMKL